MLVSGNWAATALFYYDNRFAGEACNLLFKTIGLLAKPAIYCMDFYRGGMIS